MTDPWLTTYSGKRFHFMRATEDDICIEDIAHGLSNICRYIGQCKPFYSVAEHGVRMAEILIKQGLLECALLALLHDSPEAYINDMHSDFKRLMPLYMEVEARLLDVILDKYHVQRYPTLSAEVVKYVDVMIRTPEVHSLFNLKDDSLFSWGLLKCDYGHIRPWSHKKAEKKFLKMFRRLYD